MSKTSDRLLNTSLTSSRTFSNFSCLPYTKGAALLSGAVVLIWPPSLVTSVPIRWGKAPSCGVFSKFCPEQTTKGLTK